MYSNKRATRARNARNAARSASASAVTLVFGCREGLAAARAPPRSSCFAVTFSLGCRPGLAVERAAAPPRSLRARSWVLCAFTASSSSRSHAHEAGRRIAHRPVNGLERVACSAEIDDSSIPR